VAGNKETQHLLLTSQLSLVSLWNAVAK